MKSTLRTDRLRRAKQHYDINPMDGVANMADCMLVFACGLMLSLIINWNVDIGAQKTQVDLTRGEEVTQLEGSQQKAEDMLAKSDGYEKMGTVYKDPKSGKLYMIEEDD